MAAPVPFGPARPPQATVVARCAISRGSSTARKLITPSKQSLGLVPVVKPQRDPAEKKSSKPKRSAGPAGGRSLLKKGTTGWEAEKKDLPPNDAERRLYNPQFPEELRFFHAVRMFRSFRRFTPAKAKIFTEYLHFGGVYMSTLAKKYDEPWQDFVELDDGYGGGKHKRKKQAIDPQAKGHSSEDKLLQALEDQYELVFDIEGVVRAFLSDWLVQQGHDRNLGYLETAALVVFSFFKFLVQRDVFPEHALAVQGGFDVAMFALKALPATYTLPLHLPSRLDKAVSLILKRDGRIESLNKSESIADPVAPVSPALGWALPSEAEFTAALDSIHAELPPPTSAGWVVGRRSRFTARRILELVVPVQKTLFDLEESLPTIKLSAHTERKGAVYKPEGELGPLEIRISAQAVPHTHKDLVLEADYVELVSPDDPSRSVWVLETLWTIEPGYYLSVGDDFGEVDDEEEEEEQDAGGYDAVEEELIDEVL